MRIGVLGGTFDPVHFGHLIAAEEAREAFALERVLFMSSGYPPHKDPAVHLQAELRCAMTQLAVADNPAFAVSRLEIDACEPTYTVDSLARLQACMPGAELYFIAGADMFLDLPNWKDPERLLAAHHCVVAVRPGWSMQQLSAQLEQRFAKHREHVHILNVPGTAISSSEIRQRVREGRSIRYLTPDAVVDFIMEHGFYRQGRQEE